MKNLFSLFSILFILEFSSVIYGQTTELTAIIVDQGGMSTELKSLRLRDYRSAKYKYRNSLGKLIVKTETFDVLILVSDLMSIEYIGDGTKDNRIFDVSYYWLGEKRMISGSLSVMLVGQSDFGEFSLSSNKLKQLTVSQDFDINDQNEEFHPKGYITLSDGTKLEFGDWYYGPFSRSIRGLLRQVIYFYDYKKTIPQTEMEKILNQQRYELAKGSKAGFYDDISFVRGESYGSLEFKELKSIEFEGENNRDIIITLKNGNSTNAIIKDTEGSQQGFEGLVGVSKKGEFYIERKNLRIIYYY